MTVKFTSNIPRVKNATENDIGLAIRMMLEEIYLKSTPKTPKDKEDLRKRVLRTMQGNLKGTITWDSSYAAVQEQGFRRSKNGIVYFRNYTTHGTGPHYANNAVKEIMGKLPEYIEKVQSS